jgi:uncharacterized protein YqgC (DUF456 family)
MTVLILLIGLCLALIGLLGCILPVLPGPPLSLLSLIMLAWAKHWEPFSLRFFCIMAVITAVVSLLDYALPAGGAKKYGASRWGIWGSLIGMPLGLLFFPPWGIIIGGIAGALLGELIVGKNTGDALQASWGIFVGYMLSTGLKVVFCTVILFLYLKEMF